MAGWKISGQYMETCNCSFICPCITSNMAAEPTEGTCQVAVAMKIETGEKDGLSLDGVSFIVFIYAPGIMGEGDLTVGLIVDDKASQAQTDAVAAIATGAAGGPMAGLGPLVGTIAGIERRPITFKVDGAKRTVTAGDMVEQSCEGFPSGLPDGGMLMLDNTIHPVNPRIALARGSRVKFNAFGHKWNDTSGTRNGHFSEFSWAA
jgi:hypothetical protein